MRVWVDWNGQLIAAVGEGYELLGHRGTPHTETVMGELDAVALGSQVGPEYGVIFCDNIDAVRLVTGNGKPNPRSKRPAEVVARAKEIKKMTEEKHQVVSWIPRGGNRADGAIRDLVDRMVG